LVQTARIGGFLFFDQWTLLSLRYKEARPKLVGLKSEKKSSSSYDGRKFVQRSHTGNHHLTKKLKER
jgi:hypothetical protein